MKKIIPTLILSSFYSFTHADCMFKIINYSDSEVTAKVGFYGSTDKTIVVAPADTIIEKIDSPYNCKSTNVSGLGRSYISFIKDPAYGGANYSPENNSITLMGKFSGTDGGREIRADNGTPVWLNTMGSPMIESEFEVKLNFTGRPNSRSSGTQ